MNKIRRPAEPTTPAPVTPAQSLAALAAAVAPPAELEELRLELAELERQRAEIDAAFAEVRACRPGNSIDYKLTSRLHLKQNELEPKYGAVRVRIRELRREHGAAIEKALAPKMAAAAQRILAAAAELEAAADLIVAAETQVLRAGGTIRAFPGVALDEIEAAARRLAGDD